MKIKYKQFRYLFLVFIYLLNAFKTHEQTFNFRISIIETEMSLLCTLKKVHNYLNICDKYH